MASGIFTILDDIGALMDDVAMTSKIATRKTAGILGDDLAVNAEKATGFLKNRELPVLWAITKGSFLNKAIIVPIVLTLNYFLPVAINYVLILGGIYLAFEGVEKIVEYFFHRNQDAPPVQEQKTKDSGLEAEKAKIKSAIVTDFILSIEIIIIALSTVLEKNLLIQILTIVLISLVATVGVYGIVALIVRLDDIGYRLIAYSKEKGLLTKIGKILVQSLPIIIKSLSIIGTVALLLVSGGIFVHHIDYFHHLLPNLPFLLKEVLIAFVVGLCAVFIFNIGKKVVGTFKK